MCGCDWGAAAAAVSKTAAQCRSIRSFLRRNGRLKKRFGKFGTLHTEAECLSNTSTYAVPQPFLSAELSAQQKQHRIKS